MNSSIENVNYNNDDTFSFSNKSFLVTKERCTIVHMNHDPLPESQTPPYFFHTITMVLLIQHETGLYICLIANNNNNNG